MTSRMSPERPVSGVPDRRVLRSGGRRQDDHDSWEFELRIACEACGVGWASMSSFTYQGQSRLSIACPRCGHLEHRIGAARCRVPSVRGSRMFT
jgi:DNA-directed RNA polymerase subunit RPC12/RpoP